jgi:hypothetical protein
VHERGEAQTAPLVRRGRFALDVREDIGDVVLDGAFGMAPPGDAPLDSFAPLGLGRDAALQVGLELER